MENPESIVRQAAEVGNWLDEQIERRYATPIHIPEPLRNRKASSDVTFRFNKYFTAGPLVPVGANRDWLPDQIGSGFLVCFYRTGQKDKLYPAVVNSMTSDSVFHFTYLNEPVGPQDDFEISPMQELILGGSAILQDSRIGTEESHERVAHLAAEIGHTAMAVRSLTNPDAMNGFEHAVHSWTSQAEGIVGAMVNRAGGKVHGALDLPGNGHVDIKHFGSRPGEADFTLVYSSRFDSLKPRIIKKPGRPSGTGKVKKDEVLVEVIKDEKKRGIVETKDADAINPALSLLGLAVLAARKNLGKEKADTRLFRALDSLKA